MRLRAVAQLRAAPPPSSEKSVERHARLLAELAQREAEIEIDRQVVRGDLVERRATAVGVGQLAEAPGQLAAHVGRAHRIAHRDPAPSLDAVHHEARAAFVQQQVLVAEQGEVRLGARRRRDERAQPLELVGRSAARRPAGAGRSRRYSAKSASADAGAEQRAQRARRVARDVEAPPQVARVRRRGGTRRASPRRCRRHERHADDPVGRERLAQQRRRR